MNNKKSTVSILTTKGWKQIGICNSSPHPLAYKREQTQRTTGTRQQTAPQTCHPLTVPPLRDLGNRVPLIPPQTSRSFQAGIVKRRAATARRLYSTDGDSVGLPVILVKLAAVAVALAFLYWMGWMA